MRLPWGDLGVVATHFIQRDFAILGCLSFEERGCAVPSKLHVPQCRAVDLVEIRAPQDAWPNNSTRIKAKISANAERLRDAGVRFNSQELDLLSTEGDLLRFLRDWHQRSKVDTVVLDISAFPKRFFCFFLKRLLVVMDIPNVVVTYTMVGPRGYTEDHLSEDPMSHDHLPGFAAPVPPKGDTLVVAVGFEGLSIGTLIDNYRNKRRQTRVIMAFPASTHVVRRQFRTFMEMVAGDVDHVDRDKIAMIAPWDSEQVYRVLKRWHRDSNGLTLAPFGPKPHTLGMALFAIEADAGMYYTQPKSYNPDYSSDIGATFAYVVKWDGVLCFQRVSRNL